MNSYEEKVLKKLPPRIAEAVVKKMGLCGGMVHEIRLRANRSLVITVNGKNIGCGLRCTSEDVEYTVKALCGNSLYSHSSTIREGYISAGDGVRAGICGQAVLENGRISVIRDITSVSIRIPRRVAGAADPVYRFLKESGFRANVLLYSAPGVGKTTVLRELAVKLSTKVRVALVDTRNEFYTGIDEAEMIDILRGYPRSTGIEMAVRTLSPEYILCDEIMTDDDADAVIGALGSGVHLCASIHADAKESLFRLPLVQKLREYRAFDAYIGLIPTSGTPSESDGVGARYRYDILT